MTLWSIPTHAAWCEVVNRTAKVVPDHNQVININDRVSVDVGARVKTVLPLRQPEGEADDTGIHDIDIVVAIAITAKQDNRWQKRRLPSDNLK